MKSVEKPAKRGRRPLYPWSQWFKRNEFELKRGEHFNCQLHSMMAQIREYASRSGISISISANENTLTIRKVGVSETETPKKPRGKPPKKPTKKKDVPIEHQKQQEHTASTETGT